MMERIFLHAVEYQNLNKGILDVDIKKLTNITVPFTGSEIIFAQTESGMDIVIKTPKDSRNAKREWVGLNKVFDTGIAIEEPIALVVDDKGRESVITKKIVGYNLFDKPTESVKYTLGENVRIMHDKTKIQGDEWIGSERNNFTYYDRWQFYWMRGPEEKLHPGSKTQVLLNKFASAMQDYCKNIKPVFNHNDLHDGQIIVDGTIPKIIDFENWKEESPLNDLAYYMFHCIRTDRSQEGLTFFLNGYFGKSHLNEQKKSVLMFYLTFISARAVSYFLRNKSEYLNTAKLTHEKVLEYIDKEKLWKLF